MSDSRTEQGRGAQGHPAAWANSSIEVAVGAPVVEKWVGQEVAVLSFTAAGPGGEYEIPVSSFRDGDTVTVITKRRRTRWHNFETSVPVGIRLAGVEYSGMAEIVADGTQVRRLHGRVPRQAPHRRLGVRFGHGERIPDGWVSRRFS